MLLIGGAPIAQAGSDEPPELDLVQRGCVKEQLSAFHKLCKASLGKCWSAYAKTANQETADATRNACLEKADDKFRTAFDEALGKAEQNDTRCRFTGPYDLVVNAFSERADTTYEIISEGQDKQRKADRKFRSRFFKTVGGVCKTTTSYSKNLRKPDEDKLARALNKARQKFARAGQKAVDKARKANINEDDIPPGLPFFNEIAGAVIDAVNQVEDGDAPQEEAALSPE